MRIVCNSPQNFQSSMGLNEFVATWSGNARRSSVARIGLCVTLAMSLVQPVRAGTTAGSIAGTNSAAARIEAIARAGCDAIAARVDALPGDAPLLLRSYDSRRGQGTPALPLAFGSVPYDNALAVIALLACDKRVQAERIGEALRLAAMHDTRLRDAYRAGSSKATSPCRTDGGMRSGSAGSMPRGNTPARTRTALRAGMSRGRRWRCCRCTTPPARRAGARPRCTWPTGSSPMRRMHAARPASLAASNPTCGCRARPCGNRPSTTSTSLRCSRGWRVFPRRGRLERQARRARDFVAMQWDAASGHFWMGTEATARRRFARHPPSTCNYGRNCCRMRRSLAARAGLGRTHALGQRRLRVHRRPRRHVDGRHRASRAGLAPDGDQAKADTLLALVAQQAAPAVSSTPRPGHASRRCMPGTTDGHASPRRRGP